LRLLLYARERFCINSAQLLALIVAVIADWECCMSRYELEPYDTRYEVSVGWDRPLSNFFLQVCDTEADEEKVDPMIVWLGADGYATEMDVDRVLDEASKWAVVPTDIRVQLFLDQQQEGMRPRAVRI
jgi:hypothetical protein